MSPEIMWAKSDNINHPFINILNRSVGVNIHVFKDENSHWNGKILFSDSLDDTVKYDIQILEKQHRISTL
jgi:hypothetical protein